MVTKVKELTLEQLKAMIDDAVEAKLEEYVVDPDKGLELREEVVQRLKARKTLRKARVPMEQVARKHGLKLK